MVGQSRHSMSGSHLAGEFDSKFFEKSLDSIGTLWTVNDQRRLLALHGVHQRMLEYHNNIHQKETKLDLPRKDSITDTTADEEEEDDGIMKDQLMVAEAIYFHNYVTGETNTGHNYRVHTLTYADLDRFCHKINPLVSVNRRGSATMRPFGATPFAAASSTPTDSSESSSAQQSSPGKLEAPKEETNGFTWIHLRDLIGLDTIARVFNIHELICQGFRDLRSHSSILPCDGEALITLVACNLEGFDFNMYKLYIYVSKNLIVTFQAEILPDISQQEIASADTLVLPIIENQMKIRKKCVKLGPAYLVYELAQQVLKSWDNSLEFCSYSVSYFNRIVHLNLLHRERLDIMIKMNMISAGVMLFRNAIEEANSICGILVAALLDGGPESHQRASATAILSSRSSGIRTSMNSIVNNDIQSGKLHISGSGIRHFLVPDILQDHLHTPYFIDLADAFLFTNTCLQNLFEEIVRCEGELDATIQLRSNNTSIVLSLVATVFLPLTFFAGVFGMNFQVDGGYTIGLLNDQQGPAAFYALCVFSAIFTILLFIYQGWLDTGFFGRIFKRIRRNNVRIDDSHKHNDQEANERALEEEQRRKEERQLRRSFEQAARNVEVYNFKKSMISQAPISTSSNRSNFMSFLRPSSSNDRKSSSAQDPTVRESTAELNPMRRK